MFSPTSEIKQSCSRCGKEALITDTETGLWEVLDDAVSNLLGGSQSLAQKWLLYDPDDPHQELALHPWQLENLSPLEAGQLLLDLVNQNLVRLLPNYPPRSSV